MTGACKIRSEQGDCCNLLAEHPGPHGYKRYRAKDTSLGHENYLRGQAVPAYEGRFGLDPGLFGTEPW